MLKRLSGLFWIMLLAGCGVDPGHQAAPPPMTQAELDTLPSAEIGRRLALQMNLTVADDPNVNGRNGFTERQRLFNITLQGQGYEEGDRLCRRDLLVIRYGSRPTPTTPITVRGFFSEATFARLKDYPGVAGCADPRLVFYRVHTQDYDFAEDTVRRGMGLFDRARAAPNEGSIDCGDLSGKTLDCRSVLAGLQISHIRQVGGCSPEKGGLCADFLVDDWDLRINSKPDGAIATISLFVLPRL